MKQIKMKNLLSVTLIWTLIGLPSAESLSLDVNRKTGQLIIKADCIY